MDEKTREVFKMRLYRVIGRMAGRDYMKANTNKQGKIYKRHKPYRLSEDTKRAKDLYNILYFDDSFKRMSKGQEKSIKSFLMVHRDLWED